MASRSGVTDHSLMGRNVLITGAGRGIGQAVALRFAELGARLYLVGLPGDPVSEVAGLIARGSRSMVEYDYKDVGVESQAETCVEDCIHSLGGIDILVNASRTPLTPLGQGGIEHVRTSDFDRDLYANVRSIFLVTKFALPHLRRSRGLVLSAACEAHSYGSGQIVNPIDAAMGAWIATFSRALARDVAESGVRVNAVCSWSAAETLDPAAFAIDRRVHEAAALFVFLAGPQARGITGVTLEVGAGFPLGDGAGDASVSECPAPTRQTRDRDSKL